MVNKLLLLEGSVLIRQRSLSAIKNLFVFILM